MSHAIPLHERLALNAREAGELVGLSDAAIKRLVRAGKIARVPDTDRVLIARAELERWVNARPRAGGVAADLKESSPEADIDVTPSA